MQFAERVLNLLYENIFDSYKIDLFPTHLWYDFLFALFALEVLHGPRAKCLSFCLFNHSSFPPTLWCFFLCFVHKVGACSFVSSWGDPLHLWPTIKSCRDPPSSLFPWLWVDCIPWCSSKCFLLHCVRCKVSCFTWANPCLSMPFPLVFSLVGWHHVINWWHSCFMDVMITNHAWIDLVSRVISSCRVVATMVAHAKEGLYHDAFIPLVIEVFGCPYFTNVLAWYG
jgi:hypothetical protein